MQRFFRSLGVRGTRKIDIGVVKALRRSSPRVVGAYCFAYSLTSGLEDSQRRSQSSQQTKRTLQTLERTPPTARS